MGGMRGRRKENGEVENEHKTLNEKLVLSEKSNKELSES